jgi:tRNA U34 5-methylaminomethyl-2-thiouridine-forming methyltransferase MnmC
MKKYQVIFHTEYVTTPTKQLFNSEQEAENWVNDNKSYSDDYDDIYYYNPEDEEDIYTSFEVRPIEVNKLNEEFYKMQKLAGLITEKQYNTHIQYKDYLENISKSFEKFKQIMKDEGHDVK